MNNNKVIVIGGGLAGCEAAYYLASHGIATTLIEMKPKKYTPAHESENLGELVCSNSLKSNDVYANACGLLKEEMRLLGSLIIQAADETKVPAGAALAVDREKFSAYITEKLKNCPNLTLCSEEVTKVPDTEEEGVQCHPFGDFKNVVFICCNILFMLSTNDNNSVSDLNTVNAFTYFRNDS